ncbi:hypothetical protein Fmac_027953 [Flemingia macrophylla]|uniref:Uncharacterized protein n=1 Tax=Flemingia macrophylla TaxID=520843 RepID=A0ABD1LJA1_9FABA
MGEVFQTGSAAEDAALHNLEMHCVTLVLARVKHHHAMLKKWLSKRRDQDEFGVPIFDENHTERKEIRNETCIVPSGNLGGVSDVKQSNVTQFMLGVSALRLLESIEPN